jgi:hypothetical protein
LRRAQAATTASSAIDISIESVGEDRIGKIELDAANVGRGTVDENISGAARI